MLPLSEPDRIRIAFDDHRLVATADLLLPATLARHLDLPEPVQQRLNLGDAPGRANTGDKMMTLVASALAGGDCIDDADALRTGGTAPDRGMYFILRLTQLIVKPDSRLGLLRYKIAPKCLLPNPFGHSGVGGNPWVAGTVRSYNLVFTYPCQGDCPHPGRHGEGAIHPGYLPAQLPVGPRPSTRPGEPGSAGPGLGR